MTKAKRQMTEDVKLVELVIELLDARAPVSSRNPDIDSLAKGKSRIVILNKADLADEAALGVWKTYFEDAGLFVLTADARSKASFKSLSSVVRQACREKIERDAKKGIKNRPVRAMVAGIPNVGKSTFINSYAGRSAAKTGNRPGVTKGNQWIRLGGDLELLDTPGILWPKFDDKNAGIRLALIGSVSDGILNIEELAVWFIAFMRSKYPGLLQKRYGVDERGADISSENQIPTDAQILYEIGRRRGCVVKGNEISYEKAARILIDEFRSGKLGKISLEEP